MINRSGQKLNKKEQRFFERLERKAMKELLNEYPLGYGACVTLTVTDQDEEGIYWETRAICFLANNVKTKRRYIVEHRDHWTIDRDQI